MKINGNLPLQSLPIQINSDILSKLNIGDVIKAQILEMTSNELILKLFDGTAFKASSLSDLDAKTGDVVDFYVKNKSDGKIVLETVKNNVMSKNNEEEGQLKKELLSEGVKPDTKNMEVAREMKQSQLPITKENFLKIADSLVRFKELTVSNAVFLEANQLTIEEKNIKSLKQLTDGKQKMSTKIEDILNALNELEDTPVLTQLADKFTTKKEQSQISFSGEGVKKTQNEFASNEKMGILIKKEFAAIVNTLPQKLQNTAELEQKILNWVKENRDSLLPQKWAQFLTSEGMKDLQPFGKAADVFFKKLKATISSKEEVWSFVEKDVSKESSKETIQKALNDVFVKINSPQLEKDLPVKSLYKDLYQKLESVKDSLVASSLPSKEDILTKVDQLQNNIKFLNELNQHHTYLQIPLQTFDKNTTGELYILKKDGKKKKIDPENSTLFVSLDTHHIGRFESLIHVNKKNISLHIRAENQAFLDFIKSNYGDLYKRLSDKGYKVVDIKYRILEEDVTIQNFDQVIKKEVAKNQLSIDLRL